jgi:hypothetical protein
MAARIPVPALLPEDERPLQRRLRPVVLGVAAALLFVAGGIALAEGVDSVVGVRSPSSTVLVED